MRVANKYKYICVISMVVLFVATGVVLAGQPGGQRPSPPSASDIVVKMKQELNLSDEQVSQITPIFQDEIQQMQAIMEQSRSQGADRDAVKSQMDALRQSTELKLSQYLTPDQLIQWKNMQQQPPQQKGDRRVPPGGEESFGDSHHGSVNEDGY